MYMEPLSRDFYLPGDIAVISDAVIVPMMSLLTAERYSRVHKINRY